MNKKKKNKILLLLILLLGITVGFAALATTLKINGNAGIAKNTWSVYWANVGNQTGVTPSTAPGITSEDEEHQNNILSFGVTLDKPGDFYEFQVDAVNDGTIDAMLSVITTNITSGGSPATLPSYIKYTVKYADDEEPLEKHLLAKNTTERYKIRLEFLKTITNDELNNMPEEGLEYDIDVEVPYIQADDTATDRHAGPELIPGGRYAVPMDTARQIGVDTIEANESTNDYTTLVYESGSKQGQQREVFAAFQLDDQNVIQHAYVCIVKDGVHCFSNEVEYNTNKDLLYDLYGTRSGAFGCTTSSNRTFCSGTYYEYAGQGNNLDPSIEPNDNIDLVVELRMQSFLQKEVLDLLVIQDVVYHQKDQFLVSHIINL